MNIRRGDIFYADLSPVIGSEQGGVRPVLIVQNDVGNRFSPTAIAAAITGFNVQKRICPRILCCKQKIQDWHEILSYFWNKSEPYGKHRLKERMGRLDPNAMTRIEPSVIHQFWFRCRQCDATGYINAFIAFE